MRKSIFSRREMLSMAGGGLLAASAQHTCWAQLNAFEGIVIGQPDAAQAGMQVLADGGNAIDAIVAAALTAAIATPHMTGIGGYGMSATIATQSGKRIVSIDGNSMAPWAMSADLFQPDANGKLPEGLSQRSWLSSIGWLSAGVPGILAGLQLAIDNFGTRGFGELVQPAISLARGGIPWTQSLANLIASRPIFQSDPGSRQLFYPGGKPHAAGELFRNPQLADMLQQLARADSVEAFYRGDIARRIADAFAEQGGLVTAQDLADYRARLVEPLSLDWGTRRIHTAPLTAGGISVLQMLSILQAMRWTEMPAGREKLQSKIEAMRWAWRDRVTLLGDPEHAPTPIPDLLSPPYARESAEQILAAVKAGRLLPNNHAVRPQGGTIHLSAADSLGNFVALTLTHGNSFGACVTVNELGLTLGHGISRFDPDPQHPNAPGPGKRPLHNMVPSIVTENGQPILAIGGAGGRKIPNSLFEVLMQFVVLQEPLATALAAPRVHTEGDPVLTVEKSWPASDLTLLAGLGYKVHTGSAAAKMSGVARELGRLQSGQR